MSQISLQNLKKSFGKTQVIHDLSIDVKDGELIVIVGPSGCGKSTLLRMVAGLEDANEGNILIDNKKVNELEPMERNIAMVFQNYALYPHMTVFGNMAYGLKIAKVPKEEIESRVQKAAEILELGELLERKPNQLSGGQRQRVAMGRAIVRNPVAFLFDEPLSNLDAALRSEMRVEISKLHKKINSNIIYVTHDQVEAMTLADRIVILNKGNIEQLGTPNEIYSDPNNIFVAEFIGSPKMNIIKINNENILEKNIINFFENRIKFENLKFDDEIYLGIRPEDISTKDKHQIHLNVKIDLIENLGYEKVIYSTISNNEIRIKTSDKIEEPSLEISFPKEKIYIFDKNKKRIK